MIARINHEHAEREKLEQARQELLKRKQALIAENKKRKDDLANLDQDLERFIDVSYIILPPIQRFFLLVLMLLMLMIPCRSPGCQTDSENFRERILSHCIQKFVRKHMLFPLEQDALDIIGGRIWRFYGCLVVDVIPECYETSISTGV